jgi:hypothetical protein
MLPCGILFRAKPISKRLFRHESGIERFFFRPGEDSATLGEFEAGVEGVNPTRFIDLDFDGSCHLSAPPTATVVMISVYVPLFALTTLKLR